MKIIFAGTTDFAVHHLDLINGSPHQVSIVLTQPDRRSGRGRTKKPTPVKVYSEKNSLEVYQPENLKKSNETIEMIKEREADLLLVVAYGQIIPKDILDIPRLGSVNVHASILPEWRGASPIEHMILSGKDTGGLTYMKMNEGLDTGPILEVHECRIEERETKQSLEIKLQDLSTKYLSTFLTALEKGEIEEKEQGDSLSSYAKKINKQDREINCKEEPAIKIDRKIRALTQENPCFINYKDKRLILLEAIPADTEIEPGRLLILNNYLLLGCAKNSSLNILKIQLPGKKPITAKEFISGYGDLIEG
tara:strand:- start:262 stop:1182 length:921 start_codon:yes stop_codon:yes gene_type:complete